MIIPDKVITYLMKVILIIPDEGYYVPDEGYVDHTWWRLLRTWWRLFWSYLMKVILIVLDEGYFDRIWWRLFWSYLMKGIPGTLVCTKLDIYVFITTTIVWWCLPLIKSPPSANQWKCVLIREGQFSSILLSQCIWNLAR